MSENPQIALIRAMSDHGGVVRHSGYELQELAVSAGMLGLERLAKRLEIIAESLNESFDVMNGANGQAIHDNLVQAEQATMNMMRGVLAGIDIGARNPPTAAKS